MCCVTAVPLRALVLSPRDVTCVSRGAQTSVRGGLCESANGYTYECQRPEGLKRSLLVGAAMSSSSEAGLRRVEPTDLTPETSWMPLSETSRELVLLMGALPADLTLAPPSEEAVLKRALPTDLMLVAASMEGLETVRSSAQHKGQQDRRCDDPSRNLDRHDEWNLWQQAVITVLVLRSKHSEIGLSSYTVSKQMQHISSFMICEAEGLIG